MKKYITMQISFLAQYDEDTTDINEVLHDMDIKIKDQTGQADLYDLDIFDWEIKKVEE
jgi:hypothetical protein